VLVVERNPWIGGAAVSREIEKGWMYSNCSYVCSLLRPELFRDLDLARHGLQVVPYGGGVTITSSGDILGNYTDEQVQRREFARHNPRDADAYHRYSTDVMRQCKFIRPLLLRSPPDPTSFKPRDLREMIYLGRELNKFGEQFIYDTLRFYSMSIGDFLNEYFESDTIKCPPVGQRHHRLRDGRVLARHGLRAAAPLHGRRRRVDRRLGLRARRHGAVSKPIAIASSPSAARSYARRRSSGPREGGRATGVVTENGTEYHADVVVRTRPAAHVHEDLRSEGPAAAIVRRRRTGRSAARPGSSTSRSTGCRSSRRSARTTRSPTATCTSSTRSRRWSAPTTTGRTAPGRRSRTSTS
jgi:hypothetical protein